MGKHRAVRPVLYAVAIATGALALSLPAQAQQAIPGYPDLVTEYDPREVAMLPRYCIYTQLFRDRVPGGNNKEIIDRWYAHLGQEFHALHHYCWGLMKTNRAVLLARNPTARQFYLADSINEFDYVIRHSKDGFVLLPEILSKKGENLIRLGKGPLAMLSLERATSLKPDYWPPYAHMSDYLKSTGDVKQARETLERGLAQAPDAQGLKRRLAELETSKPLRSASP